MNKYKTLVYVASPFAGDMERNVTKAQGYCRFVVSKGYIPLAPHLIYPQFMDENYHGQRKLGVHFALQLLHKCDELWVFGNKTSEGMSREIATASERGMSIRYWNSKCEEVSEK